MKDRTGKEAPLDALDEVVGAVWPEGPPPGWRDAAALLSLGQRDDAARRLDAMTRLEAVEEAGRIDVRQAAELTGLSVPRVYSMASAWRKRRDLGSLGVNVANKASRRSRVDGRQKERASAAIAAMLGREPGMSASDLERALVAEGLAMSSPTLRRLIKEGRRLAAPGVFGARIVLDSAGMDALLDGQRMRLFAVLDAGTGLVLGWIDGTERSGALALAFAADDAHAKLPSLDLGGFEMAGGEPVFEMRLHEDDVEGRRLLGRTLLEAGGTIRIETRNVGGALIDALGDRLGGVWLGRAVKSVGSSHRHGRFSQMPEYSGDLSFAVNAAIERHNAQRIEMAPRPEQPRELVEDARSGIMDRIRLVAYSYDALLAEPGYAEVFASASAPPD